MAQIDINTKFITLLGKPLGQSFAARMQNRGYEAAGLNMKYFYTEVENDHLGDVVNGLRYMNFAGFAVTKPNKVEVLKYLDELVGSGATSKNVVCSIPISSNLSVIGLVYP